MARSNFTTIPSTEGLRDQASCICSFMTKIAVCIPLLIAALTFGCKRSQAPAPTEVPDSRNLVHASPTTAPVSLVHGTLKLTTSTKFEFEVPAHSITPKLEGSFEAAETNARGSSGKIDLLVMTPDEFAEFTQGRGGTASYSVTDSSGQTVSYALPSTLDSPQKYYVVFRNPGGKSSPKTVKAELTASF